MAYLRLLYFFRHSDNPVTSAGDADINIFAIAMLGSFGREAAKHYPGNYQAVMGCPV